MKPGRTPHQNSLGRKTLIDFSLKCSTPQQVTCFYLWGSRARGQMEVHKSTNHVFKYLITLKLASKLFNVLVSYLEKAYLHNGLEGKVELRISILLTSPCWNMVIVERTGPRPPLILYSWHTACPFLLSPGSASSFERPDKDIPANISKFQSHLLDAHHLFSLPWGE